MENRLVISDIKDLKTLDIIDQVKYINNLIVEHGSLTKGCDAKGLNRSTIQKRFKNNGYAFDKTLNKYIAVATASDVVKSKDITLEEDNSKGLEVHSEGQFSNESDYEKEIARLKNIINELVLDKLGLQNTLDWVKGENEALKRDIELQKTQFKTRLECALQNNPVDGAEPIRPNIPNNKGGRPSQYYAKIKELYLDGYSYNQITSYTGANYSTVAKTIKKIKEELGI